MRGIRRWKAALAGLLLAGLASTGPAAAGSRATDDQAHYCPKVDAYRIQSCDEAIVPDSPVGKQLRWVLAQLGGDAATLTEAQVRQHFSSEFLAVVMPPAGVIGALQQTLAERGPLGFVGFSYPPRERQALAIVRNAAGERAGVVAISVTTSRPPLIEALDLGDAPPTIVPSAPYSGLFDIGGRRLFLRCTGRGSPTVVFEGGLTTTWYQLQNQLSGLTRVCSYDHPNGPWSRSDHAPTPRTAADYVADLQALLAAAGVPGPYVLAGHSNGGLYAQLYAGTHPGQVAGLVLVDAVHPAAIQRRLAMLQPLLPPEQWEQLRVGLTSLPHPLLDPEQVDNWTSQQQTQAALASSPLRAMPLVVLAHGRVDPGIYPPDWPFVEQDEQLARQLQEELAQLVPGGRLVVATQSGHNIQDDQPELVLDAIGDVVQAVRTGNAGPN